MIKCKDGVVMARKGDTNKDNAVEELPLTEERLARVIDGNSKTFKGHGKEVRK